MADLVVGRVGTDVTIRMSEISRRAGGRGETVEMAGVIWGSTLADALWVRDELEALAAMPHTIIPVTYQTDPTVDGFYRLRSAAVDAAARDAALFDGGKLGYRLLLERVGGPADVEVQDVLVGSVRTNAHGVDASEAAPMIGLPPGYFMLTTATTNPTLLTRAAEGGSVTVVRDVGYGDRPTWGIAPADWFKAACQVKVDGRVRAGLACPNVPGSWELSNGLVRVTPNGTNLRFDVATFDGTQWDTAKTWRVDVGGSEISGVWSAVTILRNDAEACAVRLVRRTLTFDFLLRRGSRFVEVVVTYNGTTSLGLAVVPSEAATAVTPTGATSPPAIRATNNDTAGNRYVVGTGAAHTQDLTNGAITAANTSQLAAFVGAEVGGSGAAAGDTAEDLTLQYLGYLAERIVPVRR